eukprot:COSAG02_NODE_55459_length_290_cov_1.073298_1_plen_72_part_01
MLAIPLAFSTEADWPRSCLHKAACPTATQPLLVPRDHATATATITATPSAKRPRHGHGHDHNHSQCQAPSDH